MGLLEKIFNKKHKDTNKRVYDEDDHIRTLPLYNSPVCFMVLIEYTPNYFQELSSFIAACTYSNIRVKLAQSEYNEVLSDSKDTENDNTEYAIKPEKIIKQKYYCITSGLPSDYASIYNYIDTISNSILAAIEIELYSNIVVCGHTYKDLIVNGVLQANKFIYSRTRGPKYDEDYKISKYDSISNFSMILKRLPKGLFSIKDIVELCKYSDRSSVVWIDKPELDITIDGINIQSILQIPRYQYEDEYYSDAIEENSLDDIFMQTYDRFNALDDVIYEDIDEVILPMEEDESSKEE
jgi:hypothetical protein